MTPAKPAPTGGPLTGSDLVGLVMNELEEYGADLDMFGQPTCDEIAAKIPMIAAAPDLLAALDDVLDIIENEIAYSVDDEQENCRDYARRVIKARALLATVRGRP